MVYYLVTDKDVLEITLWKQGQYLMSCFDFAMKYRAFC